MSKIDASSGYHSLKLDMQLSYLTTFSSPFGRYHYKCLLFGAAQAGDMFQRKINEIFNDIPNVFGIADDILVIDYDKDRADHEEVEYSVLEWCQDVNLKLNKDKCHFRCMSIPFFGKVVSRKGIQPDPQKVRVLTEMLAPKNKWELQSFLGIINCVKELARILKPLVGSSPHHIKNTGDFIQQIKQVRLQEDGIITSYDVSALFTSVPIEAATKIIQRKLEQDQQLHQRTSMKVDHITSLLEFCLKTTYFHIN